MKSWRDIVLLKRKYRGIGPEDFGPNCHYVVTGALALADIPWFKSAGLPLPEARSVALVPSWHEAIAWIEQHRVRDNAHPHGPSEKCRLS